MNRKLPKIKGFTKVEIVAFMKMKLGTDGRWAFHALRRMWREQTLAEQNNHLSYGHNALGFTKCDSPFLSSLYLGWDRPALGVYATAHQQNNLVRARQYMPKYAYQLIRLSDLNCLRRWLCKYYGRT